ncbi:beta-aspartyl-peptidase, partial [Campylobacter lari]|nr:beta-aspartyl-peptidase [Campylobacter lari]
MKFLAGSKKALLVLASLAFLTSNNTFAKDFEPIIVIHGGTSGLGLTKEEFAKREKVMKESLKAGQSILEKGGSSVDAVIAAIKVMEDSPEFNAGKGAVF